MSFFNFCITNDIIIFNVLRQFDLLNKSIFLTTCTIFLEIPDIYFSLYSNLKIQARLNDYDYHYYSVYAIILNEIFRYNGVSVRNT